MKNVRTYTLFCVLVLAGFLPAARTARAGDIGRGARAPVFVEVRLNSPSTFSHAKPGDVLQGESIGNVFSGYRLMIPTGSHISLRVSGTVRQRKVSSIQWPWPIRHFTSKYRNMPTFDVLTVSPPGGGNTSYPVSLVTVYDEIHVAAQAANAKKPNRDTNPSEAGVREKSKSTPDSTVELVIEAPSREAGTIAPSIAVGFPSGRGSQPEIETLAAGTETKLALLGELSASKSRAGDPFKAMLAEPLRLTSGEIVPQGSLFEGHVRKSHSPRWLSRPGSLYLTFNRLILPTGGSVPIAASVVGIETKRQSQMKVSSEGNLSGGRPGKKQLLADLGVGFAISKVADDGYQLITEALVSTATDASTAGIARLVGMALGGLFFIHRHGRDVVLPPYTMINIRFDRSPALQAPRTRRQGMQ